jgi:hypothetical protein
MTKTPLPSQRPFEIFRPISQELLTIGTQQNGWFLVHMNVANNAACENIMFVATDQYHSIVQLILQNIPKVFQ